MYKVAAVILVVVALIAGVLFLKPQAESPTPTSTATSTAEEVSLDTRDENPSQQTTKTYSNATHNYAFSYPSSWVMEPERNIINDENFIPSIVSVHEPKESEPMRFTITMNFVERTIKNQAPIKKPVVVGGIEATAYIFPDGLNCADDPDCSFFIIPLRRAALWYELTGANNAKTLDAYQDILKSFTFTDTD